jgi:hypothetical protein
MSRPCYHRIVRELRSARAIVALICVALLLCATIGPAPQVDLTIPVLVFCFLVVLKRSLLRVSDRASDPQPLSFLSVDLSRAPPLA